MIGGLGEHSETKGLGETLDDVKQAKNAKKAVKKAKDAKKPVKKASDDEQESDWAPNTMIVYDLEDL